MNQELRAKAGLVYNIVEAVILAMSVGLCVWLANVVIAHGEALSSQKAELQSEGRRLDRIELIGSSTLQTHVASDDKRVEALDRRVNKLEDAVMALQTAAAELKAISVKLESLQDGQNRIEKSLEQHMMKP